MRKKNPRTPDDAIAPDAASRRRFLQRIAKGAALATTGVASADPAFAAVASSTKPPAPRAPNDGPAASHLRSAGGSFYGALKPGTWTAMGASSTIAAAVAPLSPPYIEFGRVSAITEAWSGGALDADGGKLYLTGGGHYDGSFNGVVSVDLESGAFAVPVRPTVYTRAQKDAIVASWNAHGPRGWLAFDLWNVFPESVPDDGLRGAIHTYGMAFFVDGKFGVKDMLYDLRAGTGKQYPGVVGTSDTNSAVWKGRVIGTGWQYGYPAGSLCMLDPSDMRQVLGALKIAVYQPAQGSAFSFSRRTFCCVRGDTFHTIRLEPGLDWPQGYPAPQSWSVALPVVQGDNLITMTTSGLDSTWTPDDMNGCQNNTQADDGTLVYIPAADWSYFLTWNPLTGKCRKIVAEGPRPTRQTNAAYGRLQWYARRGCLVLVNSVAEPIFAFRPTG